MICHDFLIRTSLKVTAVQVSISEYVYKTRRHAKILLNHHTDLPKGTTFNSLTNWTTKHYNA